MGMALIRSSSEDITSTTSLAHGIGEGDFTVSVWVRTTTATNAWQGVWANGAFAPALYRTGGAAAGAWALYASGESRFNTTLATNTLYHLLVTRVDSSNIVTGYVDGVSDGTGTQGGSIADAVQKIGEGGDNLHLDGEVFELGLWAALLNAGEIAALAAGYSPRLIRPGSLKLYHPLIRQTTRSWDGLLWTEAGTPTVADHIPIIYPAAPHIITAPATTGPTTAQIIPGIYGLPESSGFIGSIDVKSWEQSNEIGF